MDSDLQIAIIITKKELGKRRFKIVNSIDKLKIKWVMIETSDDHSPSIVLYYKNKNDDNVDDILETCHFGNQFSFPYNDDVTCNDLSLYWISEDGSKEEAFRLN